MPSRALHHGVAIALFGLVAVLFVAPVFPDPSGLALGHPRNDTWNHIWGFAWAGRLLLSGEFPLHTEQLGWPGGGALWFIDTFGAAVTAPLQAVAGPVVAYNAYCLGCFFLAGAATYALAWRETRSVAGALVAGLLFEATPHLLAQAYNGISESLAVGWLPLAVLAIRHALGRPSAARGALAGVAVAVCTLANWYYGLFAVLCAIGFWCAAPLARRRPPARALLVTGLSMAAAATLVAGPALFAFASTLGAEDALVSRDPTFVWKTLIHHNMTDLVTFFRPGKYYSPDFSALWDEDLIVVVYIGWALLLPALAVLFTSRARRARPWLVLALLSFLLALGPFLYVGGRYVELGDGWIPLPFLGLFELVPLVSRISHAYRFTLGIALGLAIAVAWAVRAFEDRAGLRWALVLALLIGGGRLAETLLASPAVFPLPTSVASIPEVYDDLGTSEQGALLDLPASLQVLDRSRYTLYQVEHGRPIPYGLNDPSPEFLYRNRFTRYVLELERSRVALLPPRGPAFELLLGREAARALGLRWIAVHVDDYPPAQGAKIVSFMDSMATLVSVRDGVRLYRLDPMLPDAG